MNYTVFVNVHLKCKRYRLHCDQLYLWTACSDDHKDVRKVKDDEENYFDDGEKEDGIDDEEEKKDDDVKFWCHVTT